MRSYICIDLKSFYASVECRERGLNPLTTTWWWQTKAGQTRPFACRDPGIERTGRARETPAF